MVSVSKKVGRRRIEYGVSVEYNSHDRIPIVTDTGKLNPKIDFVFRRLFGSEENKDLLISLINSVVEPTPHIVDVTIKNPFNLAAYRDAKESILDIKAIDRDGTWYDIEMQLEAHSLYGRRAIYYLSKTYSGQLESGEDYSNLNTTIGIHFLDFKSALRTHPSRAKTQSRRMGPSAGCSRWRL